MYLPALKLVYIDKLYFYEIKQIFMLYSELQTERYWRFRRPNLKRRATKTGSEKNRPVYLFGGVNYTICEFVK